MFKVVCIDDSLGFVTGNKILKKGEIYTVISTRYYPLLRCNGYFLKETPKSERDWHEKRFRKLDENFGSEMAERIETEINQEQLTEV